MGKGQEVSVAYIGIREEEPQPMTIREVGRGRSEREDGERTEQRVRKYSWQF